MAGFYRAVIAYTSQKPPKTACIRNHAAPTPTTPATSTDGLLDALMNAPAQRP